MNIMTTTGKVTTTMTSSHYTTTRSRSPTWLGSVDIAQPGHPMTTTGTHLETRTTTTTLTTMATPSILAMAMAMATAMMILSPHMRPHQGIHLLTATTTALRMRLTHIATTWIPTQLTTCPIHPLTFHMTLLMTYPTLIPMGFPILKASMAVELRPSIPPGCPMSIQKSQLLCTPGYHHP